MNLCNELTHAKILLIHHIMYMILSCDQWLLPSDWLIDDPITSVNYCSVGQGFIYLNEPTLDSGDIWQKLLSYYRLPLSKLVWHSIMIWQLMGVGGLWMGEYMVHRIRDNMDSFVQGCCNSSALEFQKIQNSIWCITFDRFCQTIFEVRARISNHIQRNPC